MSLIKPLYIDPATGLSTEANPTGDSAAFASLTVLSTVNQTDAANKSYVDQHIGGGSFVKTVTVDLGPLPVHEFTVTVPDTDVLANLKIIAVVSGTPPVGKDADEIGMDSYQLTATPGPGQVTFYLRGLEGYLSDKFNLAYQIGF